MSVADLVMGVFDVTTDINKHIVDIKSKRVSGVVLKHLIQSFRNVDFATSKLIKRLQNGDKTALRPFLEIVQKESLVGAYTHTKDYMDMLKLFDGDLEVLLWPLQKIKEFKVDPLDLHSRPYPNLVYYSVTNTLELPQGLTVFDINEVRKYYTSGDFFHVLMMGVERSRDILTTHFKNYFVEHGQFLVRKDATPEEIPWITHLRCSWGAMTCGTLLPTPSVELEPEEMALTFEEVNAMQSVDNIFCVSLTPKKGCHCICFKDNDGKINDEFEAHLKKYKRNTTLSVILGTRHIKRLFFETIHPVHTSMLRKDVFLTFLASKLSHNIKVQIIYAK